MGKSLIRWGIISCGKISHDFTTAVRSLPAEENQKVVAVAARNLQDAEKFSAEHGIQRAYCGYDDLINDTEIDVVYVGSVASRHYDVASALLRAGRPVLCEKPLCVTLMQTQQLAALARQSAVFLMEAVWTRCLPAVQEALRQLRAGAVGNVTHVSCSFGVASSADSRIQRMSVCGGATLDLGIYGAQLFASVIGDRWTKLCAVGHTNDEGCDTGVSVSVSYPHRRLATLLTSSLAELPNTAHITGTRGTIQLCAPMHAPTCIVTPSGTHNFPLPTSIEGATYNYVNSAALQYEAVHVADCVRKGLMESELMSLGDTVLCAEMLEAIRKQIGVVYPQDDFHYAHSDYHFNQQPAE